MDTITPNKLDEHSRYTITPEGVTDEIIAGQETEATTEFPVFQGTLDTLQSQNVTQEASSIENKNSIPFSEKTLRFQLGHIATRAVELAQLTTKSSRDRFSSLFVSPDIPEPTSFAEVSPPRHTISWETPESKPATATPEKKELRLRSRIARLGSAAVTRLFGIPPSSSAYYQDGLDRRKA